ncbi:uncharacterized protein LOC125684392 [Lagopus muta]|uniref:uncharacterized protein LOC125684392 n=1 Tax=Lagopus muta TaxID=64668 RepID=UPI00209DAFC5|nr:uncharacterized protein LOC125684392 [Lagopus muta]
MMNLAFARDAAVNLDINRELVWALPRGGAGGGGGEEAARAEQSRGWRGQRGAGGGAAGCGSAGPRGWRGCRQRDGTVGAAGTGTANASVFLASFRPRAPLCSFIKFLLEKMDFLRFLLVFFSAVTMSRAQVQQEPAAETSEGTGINITCSHPNIQPDGYIYWYRQLPGRGPAFLVSAFKGSKEVPDPEGQLWVSADRRSSVLRLARPRLGDAALYYCAVGAREAKPGLRPGTNRLGRGGGAVPSGPAGGAACMAAKLHPHRGAPP